MVYKLYYFNGRGLGEISRLALTAAGQKFEDIRVEGDEWQKLKPSTPQGSLPVLEVNGVKICQSMAIPRFIAREFGMYGKDNMEMAKVDMVLETVVDLMKSAGKFRFEKDEEKKSTLLKKFEDEELADHLKKLEDILNANDGGKAFVVGKSLTLADIAVFNALDGLERMSVTINGADRKINGVDKSEKLNDLKKRVSDLPKIADYLKTRPDTKM